MMRLAQVENIGAELTEALDEDARGFLLAIVRHRIRLIEQNFETL
jgi:hypothetical protein